MPIPYSTERVVDMILRALRASGVIADDVSAQTIREVPNNASDADLDAIAAALNYGGVSGTDAIFAIEDFDLVIDSDDSNPSGFGYRSLFRLERGQNTLPVTDPERHILSAGTYGFDIAQPSIQGALLTVGPQPVYAAGDDRIAAIHVGYDDTVGSQMLTAFCGPQAVTPGVPGTHIRSSRDLEFSANFKILFTGSAFSRLQGGFPDVVDDAIFAVGDFNDANKSFFFKVEEDSGGQDVLTINPQSLDFTKIFFRGNNDAIRDPIQVVINGYMDQVWGDPDNFGNPTLLVLGNAAADKSVVRFHSQVANWNAASTPVFHFSTEHANVAPYHWFFRLTAAGVGVFNIDSVGDANLAGGRSYNTSGADVAEWLPCVNHHPVGTVLVIDSDGSLVASKTIADPAVAGVVSEAPAVKMGMPDDHGGVKPEGKALVAAIGRVTVRCTTFKGPIRPGDRLVSGLNGCAVRASDDDPSVAILGKSIGFYEGPQEGTVEALVSW